ncbi:hypothetical protein Ppa06_34550 [Planomonospora parontospora subsp. parontospora]|uniref:NodB homology domain-containing protein n=2 Tax=Planomonospora parontospora TaxID=58119 RepID=A0AA37F590_9ACTN|nr:polysaccharide deacetylase family protein [Planomonospora parontospora]GGK73786.1 hypothetical protein GCM10010126_36530 [Planomonospora parontospora]GII09657.1 hypothetical protein Ppa06_34550 [Planomonospora parontospora subsp. parontospora]
MKTPVYLAGALAALTLLVPLAAPAQAAAPKKAKKPQTVVALTFDDGDATQAEAARMLQNHGMRGTFYVNSGTIGQEGKLTESQLTALAKAGHEIGGHSVDHVRLNGLLPDRQREQICGDRRALMEMGHEVSTFAYPFGAVDGDARQTAKECGYAAARGVSGLRAVTCATCSTPAAESLPPANRWNIRGAGSVLDSTSVRHLKQQVLNAEKAGGGLVPVIFHVVCDDCGQYSIAPERLEEFLVWLEKRRSRGTVVRTVAQAVGAKPGPLPED